MGRKKTRSSLMRRGVVLLLLLAGSGCKSCVNPPPTVIDGTEGETTKVEVALPDPPSPTTGTFEPEAGIVEAEKLSAAELTEKLYREGLLGEVFFDFDVAEISAEGRLRLDRNARYLLAHPEVELLIEGHCDERGTHEYNLALGELRASAARDYLVRLGIAAGRLETRSYGEDRAVCWRSEENCWRRNRRAYFRVKETR